MKPFTVKPTKARGISNVFSPKNEEDYTKSDCQQVTLNNPHPFEGVESKEYELNHNTPCKKITLTTDTNTVLLQDNVTLNAKVTDENNEPIINAPVTFYQGVNKRDLPGLTNIEGIITNLLPVTATQPGSWYFTAKTIISVEGVEKLYTSNEVIIKAVKRPTSITAPETVKRNSNYTGRLIDNSKQTGIPNQKISIRMSTAEGKSKTYDLKTDDDGYFTYPKIQLTEGVYYFTIIYQGTNIYQSVTKDIFKVEVNNIKRTPLITAPETVKRYSDYTGKLTDENTGQGIPNQIINIEMIRQGTSQESKTYQSTTDDDGYFKIKIELTEGNYTFNINYSGNETYNETKTGNYNVIVASTDQIPTKIEYNTKVSRYDYYTGLLIDQTSKEGIPNKNLLIQMTKVNQDNSKVTKKYGTDQLITTDTNGLFKQLITLYSNASCNCKYYFKIIFEGDDTYLPCETNEFEVTILPGEKRPVRVLAPTLVKRYTEYTGKLIDSESEDGLENQSLIITMAKLDNNGNTISKDYAGIKTEDNGIFKKTIELYPGVYYFTVTYAGNNDYNPTIYGPYQVDVVEETIQTQLNLIKSTITYGNNLEILLTDNSNNKLSEKNIIITLNKHNNSTNEDTSKIYDVTTNTEGIATLPIKLDIADNLTYTVEAKFLSDNTYSEANLDKKTIQIIKTETSLELTSNYTGNIPSGSHLKLTATLKDSTGNNVSNQPIQFLMQGDGDPVDEGTYNTDDNGKYVLDLPVSATSGTFTLQARYTGDNNHNFSNSQYITVTVTGTTNKTNPNILLEVNDTTVQNGDTITLTATVKNTNNAPINGLEIHFYQSSNEVGYSSTNSEGKASINLKVTATQAGSWNYTASNITTGEYNVVTSNNIPVTANMIPTTLTLTTDKNKVLVGGENINFTVTLLDENNTPLNNKNIILYQGSSKLTTITTNNEGKATFQQENNTTTTGIWDYYAIFEDNVPYAGSKSNIITVEAIQKNTNLEFTTTSTSVPIGSTVTIDATLKDEDNNPLANQQVDFYQAGNKIFTLITGVDGKCSKTLTVSATQSGSWVFQAKYNGLNAYKPCESTSITISAVTISTNISLESSTTTIYKGNSLTLTARLKDSNGNNVNGTIIFYQTGNSVTNTVGTVSTTNGVATLTLPVTAGTGTFTFQAKYAGNTPFNASESNNVSVNVKSNTTSLTLTTSSYSVEIGDSVTLKATLKNSDGNNINGAIQFYQAGNLLQTVNTTNGVATLTLPVTATTSGSWTFQAKYNGSNDYSSCNSNSFNISAVQVGTSLSISASSNNVPIGGNVTFYATLKDSHGNNLSNQTINLYQNNGFNRSTTTGTNGVATFTLPVSASTAGSWSFYVNFPGTSKYISSSSGSITVSAYDPKITSLSGAPTYIVKGGNYYIYLRDYAGNPIAGRHISLTITRVKTGTSQSFSITTDTTGQASQTLNYSLIGEQLKCEASFSGESSYNSCSNTTTANYN